MSSHPEGPKQNTAPQPRCITRTRMENAQPPHS
jgi:hypothetical protein